MAVFYMLLFFPILVQHSRIKGMRIGYEKKNKFALAFFFFLMTLLLMLRHECVGTDTKSYIQHFVRISRREWTDLWMINKEIGFPYFVKFFSSFSKDPQFYLAAVALLASAMMWPTYRRLCTDASLTIVLFCAMSTFPMMFSGIRQTVAFCIGFVAYGATRRKMLIPFIVLVLLAMTLHTSAFMLTFMYPLYHARITKQWMYVVVPVLAVCFYYNQQIFRVLALILEQYTEYDTRITLTGAYTTLILFAVFVVFSFLIPDEEKLDEEIIGLRNFLLFTFVLLMFTPLHTLAMRMAYYYMIFIPLLLPRIIECRSRRWSQVAILGRHVMVVFFLLYFFWNASGEGNLDVFPYHFFWERI